MTLGGTLIIKDGFQFDFCFEAAVKSLLGCCDEVVVVDGFSEDGTWEALQGLGRANPKLRLMQAAWKPSPMGTWLADLTNVAREALKATYHINLQADEILSEDSYKEVRTLAQVGSIYTVERLNFWLDHRHLLPPNEKVGSTIVRMAPVWLPSVGDAQGLEHKQGWSKSAVKVFHYGFIRDPRKLAAKARPMQQAFFNTTDPVWEDVERRGTAALVDPANPTAVAKERLVTYNGTHPRVVRGWLASHGFDI